MPLWRRNNRRGPAIAVLITVLVLSSDPGHAQDLPEAGPGQDLYLEVFVNGQPRNLVARFTDLGDGVLSADAIDLRTSGILPGSDAVGEVRLDQIPGLGWRLIEPEQTIRFIVPDQALAPFELDAGVDAFSSAPVDEVDEDGAAEAPIAGQIDHGTGLVLNYGVSLQSVAGPEDGFDTSASAQFDARFYAPVGALSHSFAVVPNVDGSYRHRRLDSYWRSSFPKRSVQVQIGDLATRGPGWSRPVRLGGMMVERNFGLRPDLVTIPLAGFEGQAALPSTVEVFSNSIQAYSADVPAGPFSIRDLPLATGSGVARVVVRDIAGNETEIDLPFLVSDQLLRPGMADFSVSAGRPRLGIGSDSDRYGDDIFGVATLRYGVSDALTVSAHAEGGSDLAMAGLGTSFRLAHLGTASFNAAHSRSGDWQGSLVDVSTKFGLGRARVSGRVMRTAGQFTDIAALSAIPTLAGPDATEFPKQTAQLSLSVPMGLQVGGGGASLFLSDIRYGDGRPDDSTLGASYSRQLWGNASLTVGAASLRGARRDRAVSLNLNMPLGARHSVGAMTERRRNGTRHYLQANGRSDRGIPSWDWRLQADRADSSSVRGSAAVQGGLGRIEIAGHAQDGNRSLGLRVEGSVVAAGGGLFVSRQISDAFAVVDAGAPGVEVSAENRPVGRTGRSGKILVPDLRAYEVNKVTIDPLNLPLDAAIGATEMTVRPAHRAGATLDFQVEASAREALVELVDGGGRPLEVGGRVILNGGQDDFLVGFDGETFLSGLSDTNVIDVSYPDGRRCQATLGYADQPGSLTQMRGVPCT